MLSLTIEKRNVSGKLDALRASGKLPAVFYGPKEISTPIVISLVEFKKVWKKAGESSVIILKDEKGNEHEALIHEVDLHPLTGEPRHADFYVIEKGKKVQVAIQLTFTGVSPAVKDLGGILVKVRREIEIEAAPRDLPHEAIVDISKLATLTDTIHARDIVLPKSVDLKIDPDEVIASIAEAKEEIIEVAPVDLSAIEVETKGKEAKEDETFAGEGVKNSEAKADVTKSGGQNKIQEAKK